MAIDCDDLAAQMEILETEKAAIEAIIAALNAAMGTITNNEELMAWMVESAQALQIQNEINYDIAIVQMNQVLLGCIPNPWGMPMAAAAPAGDQIATHEQLRKIQNQRARRQFKTPEKPFKISGIEVDK